MSAADGVPSGAARRPRALGVDVGTVRVGVAASVESLAVPVDVLDVSSVADGPGWADQVARLLDGVARERGVDVVVVGLPRGMSGRDTASTRRARGVAAALEGYGHRVVLVDERLSSVQAERALSDADRVTGSGRSTRERRRSVDPVAASLVLQHWLETTKG